MKFLTNLKLALFGSLILLLASAPDTFAWTWTADFEQGTVGQEAEGSSGFSASMTQTLYSNDLAHTGTKSARVYFNAGNSGFGESGGRIDFPSKLGEGNELWARVYYYFKSPWSWTCSPAVKIFRNHVGTSSGAHLGYISIYNLNQSNGGIHFDDEVAGPTYLDYNNVAWFDINAWQSIEMYVKFSATQPITRIWKNGVLIKEDKTHRTLTSSTDLADFSYIFTYWNGGAPQNQYSYVDDIVLTTSKPANIDAHGNPMIGPTGWSSQATILPSQTNIPSAPISLIVK